MITRFAPSPTGPLHLGHAFSALTVWGLAAQMDGTALLRIEDTDSTRSRPEHDASLRDDLAWLGLMWPEPVRRQSDHFSEYYDALLKLDSRRLIYPCGCNRRAIQAAGARAGADGLVYPGTCRDRTMAEAVPGDAIRLDLRRALDQISEPIRYEDLTGLQHPFEATHLLEQIGDPVLRRKDTGDPGYHLACCHDDAVQDITHVVRGMDIEGQTPLHVVLQRLMGWPTPIYHHHRLITDAEGKRLAKVDRSKALATYRAEGATPEDIKRLVGLA